MRKEVEKDPAEETASGPENPAAVVGIGASAGGLQAVEACNDELRYLRYSEIFEYSSDGFVIVDADCRIRDANGAYCEMLGYSLDELREMPDFYAITPERWIEWENEEIWEKLLLGRGFSGLYEKEYIRKDGTVFPVELQFFIEKDANREPRYFLGTIRDITERKRAEDQLRHSRELMRYVIEHTNSAVAVHDCDLRYIYVSQRYLQDYGIQDQNIIGKHHYDVFPDLPEKWREVHRKALAGEVSGSERDAYERADGTVEWTRWSCRPWHDNEGSIGGIIVYTEVITERVHAEEKLHASEQTTHALLNATPDAAFLIDTAGTILVANEELARRLKQERQAILGKNIYSLLPTEVAERRKEWIDQVIRTGKALTEEDEREGRVNLHSLYPVLNAAGCASAVAVYGQDITERKRAEAEQERLSNQLSQAQKMESVGRLAGGVAHDFNNMLTVILGHTELAMEDLAADSALLSNLEDIRKAAESSANLTRQLLAFARKQTVMPEILDLNETISSMLNMLKRIIGEDIDLFWEPGAGLAPVCIDPGQVNQILANLLVNARDAVGHRNGKVTIESSSVRFDKQYCSDHTGFTPGDYIMLAVSDNGCGMDEEIRSHIFEPFFTTKGLGHGTGLGLATIYGIVKQNNGFINVYSEPGEGTTIRTYLPALEAESRKHDDTSAAAAPVGGQETILIVEDEAAILNMARTMLERLGYTVLTSSTPGEAIRTARERSGELDLVITDVVMPEMNGRDLTGRLQEYCPDIRVLFMSGYTANVISQHGVLDEGVSFIQKPFSQTDLARKIRETMEK